MNRMRRVPAERIRAANQAPPNPRGAYVLYWMTAFRRTTSNFALQRAAEWARELGKPLVVLEALRCDYPWASDRFHTFVLQGMRDNARQLERRQVAHVAYVEPAVGAGKGLLQHLASRACVVIGDDYPCFFLPRMVNRAAEKLPVQLELVDANGLLPLRSFGKAFVRAFDFRRAAQQVLPTWLAAENMPLHDPLAQGLPEAPRGVVRLPSRWSMLASGEANAIPRVVAELPIDHAVGVVPYEGGSRAAERTLKHFATHNLERYAEEHNEPEGAATSGLSPYLHFGHVSAHQVFEAVAAREDWELADVELRGRGQREGYWDMRPGAEAFLDQLITWRELGYHYAAHMPEYDGYGSVPDWAKKTLAKHGADARPARYRFEQLEQAATGDVIWNAAQRQLLGEGRIHNYLRMLWGKRVLEWTDTPEQAAEFLVRLNDKYAVDGRDPNSYSGIFWCFGRHDRAWGPERPVYGTVRYMSSAATRRKLHLDGYLARWSAR